MHSKKEEEEEAIKRTGDLGSKVFPKIKCLSVRTCDAEKMMMMMTVRWKTLVREKRRTGEGGRRGRRQEVRR